MFDAATTYGPTGLRTGTPRAAATAKLTAAGGVAGADASTGVTLSVSLRDDPAFWLVVTLGAAYALAVWTS